jgi:ADP-ribosyl-[dinitrogen reductase] hydrolase
MILNQVTGGILGLAVGDALGVPVEFYSRSTLKTNPVLDMRAYGAHYQPQGTWSDDSSLAFCLAESLVEKQEFDYQDIGNRFVLWKTKAYWTPHKEVFDIGNTTRFAISRLFDGKDPLMAGDDNEDSNGNGSLMRILPLAFFLKKYSLDERFQIVKNVSSITHRHIRSVICCFYYIEFVLKLLENKDKISIYKDLQAEISSFLHDKNIKPTEIAKLSRLLKEDISTRSEDEIRSSGYVLHTLEASIWCLLNSETYAETVLKAVNLGSDTDTTGAVAGGLAGILYKEEGIPELWRKQLVKSDLIRDLAVKLYEKGEK